MLSKMNKIFKVHQCPLMIVPSMHSMLSLQSRNDLHKEKPKIRTNVSNEDKRVKMKR